MAEESSDFAMIPNLQSNIHDQQAEQEQHLQHAVHPEDFLDEFLDTRIYEQNREQIRDQLVNDGDSLLNFNYNKNHDDNSTGIKEEDVSSSHNIINSILSRNYLEESNQLAQDDYMFAINSSNNSNNSIVPPQTPPNDELSYQAVDQSNLDDIDVDMDYSFKDYYDSSKVTNIESEEFRAYENSRKQLMKFKFGIPASQPHSSMLETTIPSQPFKADPDTETETFQLPDQYYDTTNDDNLPYKMKISGLPDHSRVETQIKLKLSISPPPPQFLLRLPSDTISKTKLRLQEEVPESSQKDILYLDTYVMTSGEVGSRKKKSAANSPASESNSPNSPDTQEDLRMNRSMKSCNICSRCVRRELKRASRRKNGTLEDGFNWNLIGPKRAVIFNCKEIISFPPPMTSQDDIYDYGNTEDQDQAPNTQQEPREQAQQNSDEKSIEILSRIICYCRHHSEPKGFRLFFVLKNHQGEVLSKCFSSPIMIMDRKKLIPSEKSATSAKSNQPLSPTSLEESSSEAFTATSDSSRPSKRKRGWSPSAVNNTAGTTYCDSVSQQRSFSVANSHQGSISTKKETLSPTDSSSEHQRSPNLFGNNSMTTPERAASITSMTSNSSAFVPTNLKSHGSSSQLQVPSVLSAVPAPPSNKPTIQRIIPAQGPIRGGIEVTLLGSNFRPGLVVKFGANQALTTHCWSDSTIVTYLPPASSSGQVLVTFDSNNHTNNVEASKLASPQQVFTYTDDTDRQLIELALQIVGLKMNGKLEDAKHIAKRIIGNSNDNSAAQSPSTGANNGSGAGEVQNTMLLQAALDTDAPISDEWFSKATETVKELSQTSSDSEDVLLKFLSLLDLPNAPIMTPNWAICTFEGQTLLHLAAAKNYYNLVIFLIKRGSRVDYKDVNEFTPLHLAFMIGNRDIIEVLIKCGANATSKIANAIKLEKISNSNVLDLVPQELVGTTLGSVMSHTRRSSNDSMSSIFNDIDGSLRQHVSRMVETSLSGSEADEFGGISSEDMNVEDAEFADESDADDLDESSEDDGDDHHAQESHSDVDSLPNYDDLFPSGASLKSLLKSVTVGDGSSSKSMSLTTREEEQLQGSSTTVMDEDQVEAVGVEDEDAQDSRQSDDKVFRFFINNSTRTTPIRRDAMLFFFWLPLLLITLALVLGFNGKLDLEEQLGKCNEFLRMSLANFMLGRERVEGMIDSVNAAVTAGLNNINR